MTPGALYTCCLFVINIHKQSNIGKWSSVIAAEQFSDGRLKGEIVLVLEGKKQEESEEPCTLGDAVKLARSLMENDGCRATVAAKQAAAMTGFKKNEIYKELTT